MFAPSWEKLIDVLLKVKDKLINGPKVTLSLKRANGRKIKTEEWSCFCKKNKMRIVCRNKNGSVTIDKE